MNSNIQRFDVRTFMTITSFFHNAGEKLTSKNKHISLILSNDYKS